MTDSGWPLDCYESVNNHLLILRRESLENHSVQTFLGDQDLFRLLPGSIEGVFKIFCSFSHILLWVWIFRCLYQSVPNFISIGLALWLAIAKDEYKKFYFILKDENTILVTMTIETSFMGSLDGQRILTIHNYINLSGVNNSRLKMHCLIQHINNQYTHNYAIYNASLINSAECEVIIAQNQ